MEKSLVVSVLFLLIAGNQSFAQESPKVLLREAENTSRKVMIIRDRLDFRSLRLEEILRKIDPKYTFFIENEALKEKRFDFVYIGKIPSRKKIISMINERLISQFEINIASEDRSIQFYKLSHPNPKPCNDDFMTWSGGDDFEATCVTLPYIMNELMEWFPEVHIYGNPKIKVASMSCEKMELKELIPILEKQGLFLEFDEEMTNTITSAIYR